MARPKQVCTIDGCGSFREGKGLCKVHYMRQRRGLDMLAPIKRFATPADRFWSHVDKTDTCWVWTGTKDHTGYGEFWADAQMHRAHRWSYELEHGSIPQGLEVDHLCRNRACVRPSHLEAVSHQENVLRGTGMSARRARQTHCIRGHEFDLQTRLGRKCGTCAREQQRQRRVARRLVAA